MDAFEREYGAPLLDEDPPPAAVPAGPLLAGIAAAGPFSLRGCVLTPNQRLDDAWVDVDGGMVTRVGTAAPAAGIQRLETDGVILPGLIDLHGHPEYNVFAAWEPPKLYANRSRWRASKEYAAVVKEPLARLKQDPSLERTLSRYAEARALVTGTTAIQGSNGKFANIEESLVRNVDRRIFGQHRARSIVDLDRTPPADRAALRARIDAGEIDAVYVHLAEGVDPGSRDEFRDLRDSGLLTRATVIVHGTALEPADLDEVAAAGASLVWSPQSNLRLYGRTTLAGAARARGIRVGLGADWLPSGSPSLLAELKVARRSLIEEGTPDTARELVRMVTIDAAAIAGLSDHLGQLKAGRPADILVLERRHPDPWEAVVEAAPSSVELVVLGGDVAYGRADWVRSLAGIAPGGPDPATL
ncbi:MAG TPA: amidohydrolase family protein, partial [Candidatus Limnocylindrales bacterium]|nr:amidohydrolase family protein [Candidatus Limnocylindrales bacterium]